MYPSSDLDALSPPAYILPRASPIKVCVYTQVLLTYREWFQSTTRYWLCLHSPLSATVTRERLLIH